MNNQKNKNNNNKESKSKCNNNNGSKCKCSIPNVVKISIYESLWSILCPSQTICCRQILTYRWLWSTGLKAETDVFILAALDKWLLTRNIQMIYKYI